LSSSRPPYNHKILLSQHQMSPIEVFSFPKSEFHDDPHLRYRQFSSENRSLSLSDQANLHFGPRQESNPTSRAKQLTSGSGQTSSLPLKYVSLPRNYLSFEMPRSRVMASTSASASRKPSRSRAPNDEPPAPSYLGYLHDELDLLIFMEAVFMGYCPHVKRRLHNHECEQIIRSGQVWICNTEASGVQRWTDGFDWSPSRALGAFLVYRQVKKAPGQEKKLLKRKLSDMDGNRTSGTASPTDKSGPGSVVKNERGEDVRLNDYIGALLDQYDYVEDGLVKKTITLTIAGQSHHVICYYSIEDAINGRLQRPSLDPQLAGLQPRPLLMRNEKILQHINQFTIKLPPQNNPSWFQPQQQMVYPPQVRFHKPSATSSSSPLAEMPPAQTWIPPPQSHHMAASQNAPNYLGRNSVDLIRPPSTQQFSPATTNPSSAAYVQQHRNQLAMRAQTPVISQPQHQQHQQHQQHPPQQRGYLAHPRAYSVPNIHHVTQQQQQQREQREQQPHSQAQTFPQSSPGIAAGHFLTTQTFADAITGMSYASPAKAFSPPVHNPSITHTAGSASPTTRNPLGVETDVDPAAYPRAAQEHQSPLSPAHYPPPPVSKMSYPRSPLQENSVDPQIRQTEVVFSQPASNVPLQAQGHQLSTYASLGPAVDSSLHQGHDAFSQPHEPATTSLPQSQDGVVGYTQLNENLENWQFPSCGFDTPQQQYSSYAGMYHEQPI
jgi:hypothetical protein